MNDLISRQAALEVLNDSELERQADDVFDGDLHRYKRAAQRIIAQLPTIDPVKYGKWIYTEVREYPVGYNLVKCSSCDWCLHSNPREKWVLTAEDVARDFNYCPNCGAKMEGSESCGT